jgi:hypothetical protein
MESGLSRNMSITGRAVRVSKSSAARLGVPIIVIADMAPANTSRRIPFSNPFVTCIQPMGDGGPVGRWSAVDARNRLDG